MKGIENIVLIVGLLIICAIAIGILVTIRLFLESDIRIPAIDYIFPSKLPSELSSGIPNVQDSVGSDEKITSTRVACDIAKALRTDLVKYNYGDRPNLKGGLPQKLEEIEPDKFVVDIGEFKIQTNSGTGEIWKFESLSAGAKENLRNDCSDIGNHELIPCSTQYLDEECVSAILSGLMVGESRICTGIENKKLFLVGAPQLDFGNSACTAADGTDSCAGFCPGGDKIGVWRVWDGGTQGKFFTKDQESGLVYPSRLDLNASYAWILFWNSKNKNWEVEIARVPEPKYDMGSWDMLEIAGKLVENAGLVDGNKNPQAVRNLAAGPLHTSLRTVWDMRVQPTSDIPFNDFIKEFQNALGENWNVTFEGRCRGDACSYQPLDVKPVGWRKGGVISKFDLLGNEYNFPFDESSCGSKRNEIMKVYLRTDLDTNKNMLASHRYRIVLRWWFVTKEGEEREERIKVICYTAADNTLIENYASSAKYKGVTRFQDLRLIILDEGPVGGGD